MDNLDFIEGVDARIYGKVSSRENLCNDFEPWHKPRKHWIRLNQWNRHILELLETTTSSQINYPFLQSVQQSCFPDRPCYILTQFCSN